MTDGKDLALMKAAQLVGFIMSADNSPVANELEWHKMACELAKSVSTSIAMCYQPMYMSDEAGKVIQVK